MPAKTHEDLPGELWLGVFRQCLSSSRRDAQLSRLSLVCKRWHELVTRAPELWDTVVLSGDRDFESEAKLRTYLERSQQMHLSVELNGSRVDFEKVARAAEMVGEEQSRLATLAISHDDIATLSEAVNIIGVEDDSSTPRPLHELQSLQIGWTRPTTNGSSVEEDFLHDFGVFSKSENLRNLSIPLGFTLTMEAAFWPKLTSLTIRNEPGQEVGDNSGFLASIMDMLQGSVALVHLVIHCTHRVPIFSPRGRPYAKCIPMTRLESIDVWVPSVGMNIIQAIEAPGLRTVSLKDVRTGVNWPMEYWRSSNIVMRQWAAIDHPLDVVRFDSFRQSHFYDLQFIFWDVPVNRIVFVDCTMPDKYEYGSTIGPVSDTEELTIELHRCDGDLDYVCGLASWLQERSSALPRFVINDRSLTSEEIVAMLEAKWEAAAEAEEAVEDGVSSPFVLGGPFHFNGEEEDYVLHVNPAPPGAHIPNAPAELGAAFEWNAEEDEQGSDNSPPATVLDLADQVSPFPLAADFHSPYFHSPSSDGQAEDSPEPDERHIPTTAATFQGEEAAGAHVTSEHEAASDEATSSKESNSENEDAVSENNAGLDDAASENDVVESNISQETRFMIPRKRKARTSTESAA